LVIEAINGARISVGPPFFEASVSPLLGLMLVFLPVAPLLAWKQASGSKIWRHIWPMLMITAVLLAIVLMLIGRVNAFALATIGLGIWVMTGVAADIMAVMGLWRQHPTGIWRRLIGIPLPRLGMNLAHLGVAVFTIGVAGVSFFDDEVIKRLQIGDHMISGNAQFTLARVAPVMGPNYTATAATVIKTASDGEKSEFISEIRTFPVARSQTTEAAIQTGFLGDTYLVFGGGTADQGFVIRIYQKPLITWIWGGAGLMVIGGIMTMLGHSARRQEV